MSLLDSLNERQKEAVIYGDGPLLVLAGAGSGKTRVLTHRIAHLISTRRCDPTQILALTFTNKAAGEMRERVSQLLSEHLSLYVPEDELWVSTFHSACVRILRSDIHHLGYSNQFTIYDDGDQRSVVKACLKELNISENAYGPKMIQARINKVKNDGQDLESYEPSHSGPHEDIFVRVFERYTEVLRMSSALDFADLILMTVKLLRTQPRVLLGYQDRFRYLLIDEYQDTNRCQYLLMKLLAGDRANICGVGDEDQSIYRWRGADISNILNFEKDYPNTKIIKLEENYRSTKNIIEAASRVIANNVERREKALWTTNQEGDKIHVIESYDEHDEAHKVINEISNCLSNGYSLSQLAVFYRTNAQSRLLEDMLRSQSINYEIYGGLKFYERLEVKDAMAYLRLLVNQDDDVSFRRIVNVPPRGIGEVSLKRFGAKATECGMSYFRLLEAAFGESPSVALDLGRSKKNFQKFYDLMVDLRDSRDRILPSDLLNYVLESSGYKQKLVDEQTVEAQTRLENLAELKQSIVEYELRCGAENPDETIKLEGFLEQIALVSDIDRFDPTAPALKMMTIHMAKGLEFDVVFIVGLEEELFPNTRPWEGEDDLEVEEERRLFYVGMTRAKQRLYLLFAKNRTIFGNKQFRVLSRFIEEIPEDYLELKKADYFTRRRPYVDRPALPGRPRSFSSGDDEYSQLPQMDDEDFGDPSYDEADEGLSPGSLVRHPAFGKGIIRQFIDNDKVMVEFPGQGLKKISLKYGILKGI